MPDDMDLTAELDAAEDIMTGRVESVEIQWGVRYEQELTRSVAVIGTGPDNERRARHEVACWPETAALVRRTVTYTPWQDAR